MGREQSGVPDLTLLLVRHGATAWNEGGQWQGWTDNPLGDTGRAQAEALREELAGQSFAAAYTSDLRRARQTAELALPGRELREDARLRELNLGDYEGHTLAQMQAHGGYAAWQADPWTRTVPGGESLQDVADRLRDWLSDVQAAFPGGRVIAFSHSIAIRTLTRELLGLALEPQENYPIPYAERIRNGRYVVLNCRDGVWQRAELIRIPIESETTGFNPSGCE